jgi:predicted nucleic acid-binding protein
MIVMDASAALELLAETPRGAQVAARIGREAQLHAPHLLDIEVVSGLRRHATFGVMTPARARLALAAFRHIPIRRYPHLPLLDRVWEFRHNLSAYDACYVALTEALDATLLTCDGALRSARIRRGSVEMI